MFIIRSRAGIELAGLAVPEERFNLLKLLECLSSKNKITMSNLLSNPCKATTVNITSLD
jgi:hypothetical protein